MLEKVPFLLENVDDVRGRIRRLEKEEGKQAQLWKLLKESARNAPMSFGWFTPFVALMTKNKEDIEHARKIIFTYIDKLEPMSFCSGLQYHFWCFAFPHAKICMYFQWLCTIGAFEQDEISYIEERLVSYHFVNFFYGMRTKPEPECVDNQTLSLALSCTIVGYLFSQGVNASRMAQIMLRDGSRRLPEVIGDMPVSGYSGEGSSYMDCVNGPAIPLAVEVLERLTGEKGLLFRELAPNMARPVNVLRMVAREFMPGGLLLPWDNYGYQFGVRSALAYGASRTGERLFYDVLEQECIWTYDIGVGWAYDDLVWTLIWWPSEENERTGEEGSNWFEPSIGGTLVSADRNHYLMQMWDKSTPVIPTRAHVNPNAVLFNGYKVPISADGSPMPERQHTFQFEDTWRSVGFLAINTETRYNYGDGCCGAHSCILIDLQEGMRAYEDYPETEDSGYDAEKRSIYADVTPIYRENFPDVEKVYRKSAWHCGRFFTIEDVVCASKSHLVTSRFLFRPEVSVNGRCVRVETPEGVVLYLQELLLENEIHIKEIENHPFKPDARSQAVDFEGEGKQMHRLFVAMISNTVEETKELTGFVAAGDPQGGWSYEEASAALQASDTVVPMKLPAYMETSLPNYRTWWYRKTITKTLGPAFVKLPAGIYEPRLFLNGREADLSGFKISQELIAPRVKLPRELEQDNELEIVFRVNVPVSHYDGDGDGTIGMTGGMWLCRPVKEEALLDASYQDGRIEVVTDRQVYRADYGLQM